MRTGITKFINKSHFHAFVISGTRMLRVIAHLDLDCFYCQVEHKRLGIPKEEPLAVQQWNSVIAINYAARAQPYAIKRGMSAEECKRRCPSIHLIHVEIIGDDKLDKQKNSRTHSKVTLERYRQASNQIMSILQRFSPLCERASIDEAYLDVSSCVAPIDNEMSEVPKSEYLTTIDGSVLPLNNSISNLSCNTYDELMIKCSAFIYKVRTAVYKELGYTVSAGIAPNKLLAKQASACRKPNKQTLITFSSIDYMMKELKLKDVRGLGGKLGDAVFEYTNAVSAADVQLFSESELSSKFGEKTGKWLYKICRGMDDEPVKVNLMPKSLLAFKSFSPIDNRIDLEKWLRILCEEVSQRMLVDRQAYQRYPKNIIIQHRGELQPQQSKSESTLTSRTGPMSAFIRQRSPTVDELFVLAISLFLRLPKLFPVTCIGIGATGMEPLPLTTSTTNESNKNSISHYMSTSLSTPKHGTHPTELAHDENSNISEDDVMSSDSLLPECPVNFTEHFDEKSRDPIIENTNNSFTVSESPLKATITIVPIFKNYETNESQKHTNTNYSNDDGNITSPASRSSAHAMDLKCNNHYENTKIIPIFINCKICNKLIQNIEVIIQEHADYHYSLKLQSELETGEKIEQEIVNVFSNPNRNQNKRKSNDKTQNNKNAKKIDTFFSKLPK